VIIPEAEGSLTLPEVRVPWWDVERGEMRVAVVPAARFSVGAGSGSPSAQAPEAAAPPKSTPEPSTPDSGDATQGADAGLEAPAQSDDPDSPAERRVGVFDVGVPWPWIAGGLALAWLITMVAWFRARRARSTRAEPSATPRRVRPAPPLEAALAACEANDPRAARTALGRWQRQAQLSPGTRAELEDRLATLDAALFDGTPDDSWRGDDLAAWLRGVAKDRDAARRRPAPGPALPPLHPR
jgi:hypothetical protein